MKNINNKVLSIQVSLNGLSFCIKNNEANSIEHLSNLQFKNKENPLKVERHLEEQLDKDLFGAHQFKTVTLIHRNELSTLIPQELFNENHLADYLKFNAKILKSDFISTDRIESNNSHNVYVPLVNVNNIVLERYGEFVYKHSSTVLVETLLNKTSYYTDPSIYINLEYSSFDLVITEKGKLTYINSFEFSSPEDLSYYVLFTMEQLQLDREKTRLRFIGGVDRNDKNFEIIYKYVRDVDVLPVDMELGSLNISQKELNKNFVLLNSFD